MNAKTYILVTGGAGFIGSHLVRRLVNRYPYLHIVNLDALTYAGNLASLEEIVGKTNYTFVRGDIRDKQLLQELFATYSFKFVYHLAAESHVDRSIEGPLAFVETNVVGTANLLEAARANGFEKDSGKIFFHISTDEVFGSLGKAGKFTERTPYDPHSPYSASKASSDHLVRAYADTYGMPVIISNCSNNFGSFQYPEKLIPVVIQSLKNSTPIPVYGKGENIRDWLWVEDHVNALDILRTEGKVGETYCIGGNNEWTNLQLVEALADISDELLDRPNGTGRKLITFVTDRLGHDLRYAIDSTKIQEATTWKPSGNFKQLLRNTFIWYLTHDAWLETVLQKKA